MAAIRAKKALAAATRKRKAIRAKKVLAVATRAKKAPVAATRAKAKKRVKKASAAKASAEVPSDGPLWHLLIAKISPRQFCRGLFVVLNKSNRMRDMSAISFYKVGVSF